MVGGKCSIWGLAVSSLAILASSGVDDAFAKEKVKIAFVGPLTGSNSQHGIGGRNSAELAVELMNADPATKYEYELVAFDDECKPNVGVQVVTKIGRGIITEPQLLVIDEPSLGLSPLFVQENFELIRSINSSGVNVLLVEQNVNQTLAISHYGYVLSQGRIAVEGKAADLLADAEVQRAYFGAAH